MESELPLYLYFLVLALSIGALVWGAERFVSGSAGIASNLGLSPVIIGLTLVSFGTSAPEILVSASAALNQSPSLAVGNALGSNLANIGLVLGVTALITPLLIKRRIARIEMPIMVAVTLIAGAVLYNNFLGRMESIGLAVCLLLFLMYLGKTARQHETDPELGIQQMRWLKAVLLTLGGLLLLILSSNTLVWSATEIARSVGVSDLLIGITLVAVGTSLPELAASIASALKGHAEIAIGNVIGSNIFNLTAVLPVAGIIYPARIEGAHFWQDFGSVLLLTLFLSVVCLMNSRKGGSGSLGRVSATLMLGAYIGYYALLLA